MAITKGQADDLAASTGHARSRGRCSWAAGRSSAGTSTRGRLLETIAAFAAEVRVLRLEHDGTAHPLDPGL
jgi:hypothetical protein